MQKLKGLQPERVFHYFEEISAIPRGSGNMDGIASYCMAFAKEQGLKAVRDDADNVIIYKSASEGYENAEPVILQGHLDMVCQKIEDSTIDFEKDGIDLVVNGDYVSANGTTLGADNGIAIAMVMAILEDKNAEHPAIEALFTTDEEIGMIGAGKLSGSLFSGRKLINLDAEESELLTVSCAGGSDFVMEIPVIPETVQGTKVTITVKGLTGGHSGVEIHKGRVNANVLMGRILHFAKSVSEYQLICVNGGDKANAIPLANIAELVVADGESFKTAMMCYMETVQKEISDREPGFIYQITIGDEGVYAVMDDDAKKKVTFMLLSAPDGVQDMSVSIPDLVETSLNMGILKTEADKVLMHFALRSNKQTALAFLEAKLLGLASFIGVQTQAFGHYPPWEFREGSDLQKLYKETYLEKTGKEPTVVAIHAGLECGVLSSKIPGLDCIAIGPDAMDVHTVHERIKISSVGKIYEIVQNLLKKCR